MTEAVRLYVHSVSGGGGGEEAAAARLEYSVALGSVGDSVGCIRELGLALVAKVDEVDRTNTWLAFVEECRSASVVVAALNREVLIDVRAGELITERGRLAPKQIPQLLTARLLIRRKTVGNDGLVEAMGVSWRPGFGGLCPA